MQEYIPIIIDIAALLVMLGYIYRGYKNGFLYTVLRFISTVLSALGAYSLAKWFAPMLTQNTRSFWLTWTTNQFRTLTGMEVTSVDTLLQSELPEALQSILSLFGVKMATATETKNVVEVLTDSAILPVVTGLLEILTFLIAFGLLSFLCRLLVRRFRRIRMPIIGTCNALLGALLGILQGALVLLICTTIASLILAMTNNNWPYFNSEIVRYTHLFSWIYQMNPFRIV